MIKIFCRVNKSVQPTALVHSSKQFGQVNKNLVHPTKIFFVVNKTVLFKKFFGYRSFTVAKKWKFEKKERMHLQSLPSIEIEGKPDAIHEGTHLKSYCVISNTYSYASAMCFCLLSRGLVVITNFFLHRWLALETR